MSLEYVVNTFARDLGPSKVQILEIEGDSYAILKLLNLPGDVVSYTMGIFNFGGIYEVGIFSHFAMFKKEDDVPQWVAVLLLQANCHPALGAWSLKEMGEGEQWAFYRDRVPLADFTPNRLHTVVLSLLSECAGFDQTVIEARKRS